MWFRVIVTKNTDGLSLIKLFFKLNKNLESYCQKWSATWDESTFCVETQHSLKRDQ